MGHGLKPKQQGVHVVFAAGTGVLCFVDLVAAIAQYLVDIRRRGSSINSNDQQTLVSSNNFEINWDQFELHLYASFPRRSESIAVELFEALDAFCKREQRNNFKLFLRLSQENVNPQRWDADFIQQEVKKLGAKNIARLWVCGPPVMNETFDRVFSSNAPDGAGVGGNNEGEGLLGNTLLSPE